MYIEYNEYIQLGGSGEIDAASFNRYEYKAEQIINAYTFSRLANFDVQPPATIKAVKMCIIELILIFASTDGDRVASWSNGGINVSYQNLSQEEIRTKIRGVVRDYLINCSDSNGIRVMFCGGIAT